METATNNANNNTLPLFSFRYVSIMPIAAPKPVSDAMDNSQQANIYYLARRS
jgi:hypothetical protein